jgi:FtsX-like permease family
MALGASRRRIVFQLLTESLLLALAGVALAWKAGTVLLNMASPGPERVPLDLAPDATVLAFTLGVTALTALLFGTLPAFRASGLEFTPALKDGRGGSQTATRGALARSLIVGQIALSVVLLVAAGLFVRSLIHLSSVGTRSRSHYKYRSSPRGLPPGRRIRTKSCRICVAGRLRVSPPKTAPLLC